MLWPLARPLQFDKPGLSGDSASPSFPPMLAAHLAWSAVLPTVTVTLCLALRSSTAKA